MAYTYFNNDNSKFHNDVEEYINGYITSFEIREAYPLHMVIGALRDAHDRQIRAYNDDSGLNKVTILSAKHVVCCAIEELEEEFPIEEFPELWV